MSKNKIYQNIEEKKKPEDEDGDQNFIKKDETAERRKKDYLDALKNAEAENDVRPEGNQQRDLNRETGGLEIEEDPGISEEDAWDKRSEEITKMIEEGRDLNNASKSSRAQAFIHTAKQKKLKEEHDKSAGNTKGHVEKLMQWRQNVEVDDASRGGGDGGRVM